jgi:DNA-binding GntR family transcriptional regulator
MPRHTGRTTAPAAPPPISELAGWLDLAPPRFATAAAYVLEHLRRAILSGVLADGTVLRQDELAERFGLSRMPVREAMRRLEAEGLLELKPHRGAVVASLSIRDISEKFEIRFALEGLALRLSVPNLTAAHLREARRQLAALAAAHDIAEHIEAHHRFHLALYAGADRPHLKQLIQQQHDAIERYIRVEAAVAEPDGDLAEHRALLAACSRHDVARALALSEEHILGAGARLVEAIEARRAPGADATDHRPAGGLLRAAAGSRGGRR